MDTQEQEAVKTAVKILYFISFIVISLLITISFRFGYYMGKESIYKEIHSSIYKKEIE